MSQIEAKSICIHKLEDLLVDPMFTIFHVQHSQIASRTETQNSLLFHFKSSMAKVRNWNMATIKDFCETLMTRFPILGESFERLFLELQELTCKILNETSDSSSYEPVSSETFNYLHSFISACSDAFISNPDWFAVEESSTEYQTCKNNAKARMKQANVVENTVMNFVKVGPKLHDDHARTSSQFPQLPPVPDYSSEMDKSEGDSVKSVSVSDKSQGSDKSNKSEKSDNSSSKNSQDSRGSLKNKSINMVSGDVQSVDGGNNSYDDNSDSGPQFSTPFANIGNNKKDKAENADTDWDSMSYGSGSSMMSVTDDEYDTYSDSSDSSSDTSGYDTSDTSGYDTSDSDSSSDSSDTSDSGSDSSDSFGSGSDSSGYDSSDSSDSESDTTSSDSSVSSFDTEFDDDSSSSESDSSSEGEYSSDPNEKSDSDISVGDISSGSENASENGDTMEVPVDMLTQILTLKRKENRHRKKKRKLY